MIRNYANVFVKINVIQKTKIRVRTLSYEKKIILRNKNNIGFFFFKFIKIRFIGKKCIGKKWTRAISNKSYVEDKINLKKFPTFRNF